MIAPVLRWLAAAMVAGLALQATGTPALLAPDDCVTQAGEQPPGADDCARCLLCACCSQLPAAVVTVAADLTPAPEPGRVRVVVAGSELAPDPRDILHVPRRS
jgi:hypothetical protein